MTCISFQNPGIIDLRAATTFGVNVKPDSRNPIGFFGTGLKYAIAILLRTNHKIELWRGLECHTLSARSAEVRGKAFSIVCLDDKELGFTTEVGKLWPLWTALRELECNVKDENGFSKRAELPPQEGFTTLRVYGEPFYDEYGKYDEIFIGKKAKPIYADDNIEIYSQPGRHIYYRGVKAGKFDRPSIYTYNVLDKLDLTEDRTIKFSFYVDWRIVNALKSMDNERILRFALIAHQTQYESKLNFGDTNYAPGETFMRITREFIQAKNTKLNQTARKIFFDNVSDEEKFEKVTLNAQFQADLDWAIALLHKLDMHPERYKIEVVESIGEDILGMANRSENSIRLAIKCFHVGRRMVASTLLEEYIHLAHNLDDNTRSFQNFVLDLLLAQLDKGD